MLPGSRGGNPNPDSLSLRGQGPVDLALLTSLGILWPSDLPLYSRHIGLVPEESGLPGLLLLLLLAPVALARLLPRLQESVSNPDSGVFVVVSLFPLFLFPVESLFLPQSLTYSRPSLPL